MIPLWFSKNHADSLLGLSGTVVEKVPLILLALTGRVINVQVGAVHTSRVLRQLASPHCEKC